MTEEKKKSVRLTERDLSIMIWINSHRVVTVEQLRRRFGMSLLAAKKRLYELRTAEYLVYEKVFQNKLGVYRVAPKGIAVTNDEFSTCKIRLGSYDHDLALVDLAIALEQRENAIWITDRQIRHENGLKGVGVKGHSPDGILKLKTGEKIAVELELSMKGTNRLEKILKEYNSGQYKEVWYFVKSEAIATKILSGVGSLIRVFLLPDMREFKANASTVSQINKVEEQKAKDFFRRK
ncbi:replication-relaxation family protein [Sporomusa aerivorans]|uniref:replication-relaxation family protein n=1 Tax=Sporomusa aerivorans TaxID=204936 RepID=UPI00352A3247